MLSGPLGDGTRAYYLITCLHVSIQLSIISDSCIHCCCTCCYMLCYCVVILSSIFVLCVVEPIDLVATLRQSSDSCCPLVIRTCLFLPLSVVCAVLVADQPLLML